MKEIGVFDVPGGLLASLTW